MSCILCSKSVIFAVASNHVEDIQDASVTIINNFSSYTQITTGTEASSKYYRLRTRANGSGGTAWAGATGRLTFDFNSDGGATADLSIYWNYNVNVESDAYGS